MCSTKEYLSKRNQPMAGVRYSRPSREGHQGEILTEQTDIVGVATCKLSGNTEPVFYVEPCGDVPAIHIKTITVARRRIRPDVVVAKREIKARNDEGGVGLSLLRYRSRDSNGYKN